MLTVLLQYVHTMIQYINLNGNEAFDNHLYLHKVHAWKWIGRNLRQAQNGNIHVLLAINSIHAKAIQAIL